MTNDKIKALETLRDRGATPGERDAARRALLRIGPPAATLPFPRRVARRTVMAYQPVTSAKFTTIGADPVAWKARPAKDPRLVATMGDMMAEKLKKEIGG